MTNVIVMLKSLGWQPIMHNLWQDHNMCKTVIDYSDVSLNSLAAELVARRVQFDTARASYHYLGTGMLEGVDWDSSSLSPVQFRCFSPVTQLFLLSKLLTEKV